MALAQVLALECASLCPAGPCVQEGKKNRLNKAVGISPIGFPGLCPIFNAVEL